MQAHTGQGIDISLCNLVFSVGWASVRMGCFGLRRAWADGFATSCVDTLGIFVGRRLGGSKNPERMQPTDKLALLANSDIIVYRGGPFCAGSARRAMPRFAWTLGPLAFVSAWSFCAFGRCVEGGR